jgi:hypothetical protein
MNPLLLTPISEILKAVVSRVWPDPVEQAKVQLEFAKMQMDGSLAELTADTDLAKAQIAVNIEEAKSTNWFVAGARPFIMWGCGFSFLYAALFEPMARFIATVFYNYKGPYPVIDTTLTMQVLIGLLGLGAARTIEKWRGVEGNR